MMLSLPAHDLLASALEHVVLRNCEFNLHWALQLSWIAVAHLEEHRPEIRRQLDTRAQIEAATAYRRAARLLDLIEYVRLLLTPISARLPGTSSPGSPIPDVPL